MKMRDTLESYDAPAYDLVSEEDSLHLRVLDMIASLVLDNLLGRGVDEADVDVLLLPDACEQRKTLIEFECKWNFALTVCVKELKFVFNSIICVLTLCFLSKQSEN